MPCVCLHAQRLVAGQTVLRGEAPGHLAMQLSVSLPEYRCSFVLGSLNPHLPWRLPALGHRTDDLCTAEVAAPILHLNCKLQG